jgi:hypothetical protein
MGDGGKKTAAANQKLHAVRLAPDEIGNPVWFGHVVL